MWTALAKTAVAIRSAYLRARGCERALTTAELSSPTSRVAEWEPGLWPAAAVRRAEETYFLHSPNRRLHAA